MARTLFLLALIVVAASAFVQPANRAVSRNAFAPRPTVEAPKMMLEGSDVVVSQLNNANLIASNVSDFGGYLFPLFGLLGLSALILFLAPPLGEVE
mmetsp:Transcript_1116/g.1208  ORF Transcript_1116/g.1208 Transcript_1116/m.1208 type:complete len:96 (+) Transcript_1116:108-395(+)|eukprot:CAMPEP_0198260200 /NCGR_PEP_ID=MMETSP1447-20131203/9222_1 /TAXON_ID=420782 /ORGANISM="Chaetoceros dichaeta, Strain CCMP1751" /LENGTH=95 /DNA_ID=CAMNT_0043947805 /DNA_START=67 /DNA_END=354 /DNA_ORIENTATION=+